MSYLTELPSRRHIENARSRQRMLEIIAGYTRKWGHDGWASVAHGGELREQLRAGSFVNLYANPEVGAFTQGLELKAQGRIGTALGSAVSGSDGMGASGRVPLR